MHMNLPFTKMHGASNDFVIIDATKIPFSLSTEQISHLANRYTGIGFDQLLVVEPSTRADFKYRIFNADGGEVAQCGNGARCFAKFVYEQGLTDQHTMRVETASGIITPKLESDGQVTVDMGAPRFQPSQIPMAIDQRASEYTLAVSTESYTLCALSMGNPHAVLTVENTDTAAVTSVGPAIQSHDAFPESVNVGFMQVIDAHAIKLRVYERGSGETLACGTGACAAVVAGIQQQLLASPVTVHTRGGTLMISWDGDDEPVLLTGPAQTVFTGNIELDAW